MQITIKEMKDRLSVFPDDAILDFSTLDFSRLKQRGDKLVQVEFEQNVYRDDSGRFVVDEFHERGKE